MLPHVFSIGNFFLPTYGVLVALAFLTALWMTGRLAGAAGLNREAVPNLGIYCAMAAILGAKLMMFLIDLPYYWSHPGEIFSLATLQAGGVFYGGLIAALITAIVYMRRKKLPPCIHSGCLRAGHRAGPRDRHGSAAFRPAAAGALHTHLPWAVTFTNPEANRLVGVPLGVPLHPTQLYESAAELIIFAILYRRFRKPHTPGTIISLYLMLYSSARFLVEFVRFHEQPNPFGGPLNTSQWISLLLLGVGAAYFLLIRKKQQVVAPVAG